MKNLRISLVRTSSPTLSEIIQDAECIVEDGSTPPVIFVATRNKIHVVDTKVDQDLQEISNSLDWSTERGDSPMVNLSYMADSSQVIAVMESGLVLVVSVDTMEIEDEVLLGCPVMAAAWSPDLDTLVTAYQSQVTIFDRMFTPVHEVDSTVGAGSDQLVTVGWGSKQTQFQGSAGKGARERDVVIRTAFPDDSHRPHISWRGDGVLFALSYLDEEKNERRVAMFNREGELLSRLENDRPLEENVAVKPNGNYIATTTRNEQGQCTLRFFERNGEFRHETTICGVSESREGVAWDCEGLILGVHVRGPTDEDGDSLELWTVSNYDWTCKLRIPVPGGIRCWSWSAEVGGRVSILRKNGIVTLLQTMSEYTVVDSTAVVVATDCLRVTDMVRPIPPPMCAYSIAIPNKEKVLLVVLGRGQLAIITHKWNLIKCKEVEGRLDISEQFPMEVRRTPTTALPSSGAFDAEGNLYISVLTDMHQVYKVTTDGICDFFFTTVSPIIWSGVSPASNTLAICMTDGTVVSPVDDLALYAELSRSATLRATFAHDDSLVSLQRGSLKVDDKVVHIAVSSFLVYNEHLLYITLQSRLQIVKLNDPHRPIFERAVELGSELVCVSEGGALTMQMPRGNLETVYPRPFTVGTIVEHVKAGRYIAAMIMSKKHRIDMNLIVDVDPQAFLAALPSVLNIFGDPDLPNLLIADLRDTSPPLLENPTVIENKISTVCGAIVDTVLGLELSRRLRLFTVLLSALLKLTPPKVLEALSYIREHSKQMSGPEAEVFSRRCLHHCGFFVETNSLFNTSLATYDLPLVVQVAEALNRDPKEYLPLVNRLRVIKPEAYRCYHVDLVRSDFKSALSHIVHLDDKFDEAVSLIKEKDLYAYALTVYQNTPRYKQVCALLAGHLESRARWVEAALMYEKACDTEGVMRCAEKSGDGRQLLNAGLASGMESSIVEERVKKMARSLAASSKWIQAAEALALIKDSDVVVSELSKAWCGAGRFDKAVDLCLGHPRLLHEVRESTVLHADNLIKTIKLKEEELKKFTNRLWSLREEKGKKIQKIGEEGGGDLDECDAFSEASTLSSASRRSGSSRASTTATQRRRKQVEKKKQSLREGGAWEDAALLIALHKIYQFINQTVAEAATLLSSLVRVDSLTTASELQACLSSLQSLAVQKLHNVWPNRITPSHLTGPLHYIYTIDDVLIVPEAGGMPQSIILDPEMSAPQLDQSTQWKLSIIS